MSFPCRFLSGQSGTVAQVFVELHHQRVFLLGREVVCSVALVDKVGPAFLHQLVVYLVVVAHLVQGHQVLFDDLPASAEDVDSVADFVEQVPEHDDAFIDAGLPMISTHTTTPTSR